MPRVPAPGPLWPDRQSRYGPSVPRGVPMPPAPGGSRRSLDGRAATERQFSPQRARQSVPTGSREETGVSACLTPLRSTLARTGWVGQVGYVRLTIAPPLVEVSDLSQHLEADEPARGYEHHNHEHTCRPHDFTASRALLSSRGPTSPTTPHLTCCALLIRGALGQCQGDWSSALAAPTGRPDGVEAGQQHRGGSSRSRSGSARANRRRRSPAQLPRRRAVPRKAGLDEAAAGAMS